MRLRVPRPSVRRSQDYVAISEVDTAAGAVVRHERTIGRMKFPIRWLHREGLNARSCRIIRVVGESMEPTLPDGCSILVNHEVMAPEHGKIFVIRTGDELIVKRKLHHRSDGSGTACHKGTQGVNFSGRPEPLIGQSGAFDPERTVIEGRATPRTLRLPGAHGTPPGGSGRAPARDNNGWACERKGDPVETDSRGSTAEQHLLERARRGSHSAGDAAAERPDVG